MRKEANHCGDASGMCMKGRFRKRRQGQQQMVNAGGRGAPLDSWSSCGCSVGGGSWCDRSHDFFFLSPQVASHGAYLLCSDHRLLRPSAALPRLFLHNQVHDFGDLGNWRKRRPPCHNSSLAVTGLSGGGSDRPWLCRNGATPCSGEGAG
jgi:hypothetical protein